jgi:hypothetical protein
MYKILQIQQQMLEQGQIVPRISDQITTTASRFTVKTRAHICKHHTRKRTLEESKVTQTGTEITETSMVSQATSSAAQQAPRYLHMTMKRHIPFLPRADGLLTFTLGFLLSL